MSKLIISDSIQAFAREVPEDLRRRLSLFDIDRLYKIFADEWNRLNDEILELKAQVDNYSAQMLSERRERVAIENQQNAKKNGIR